jgi:hypothetical protein
VSGDDGDGSSNGQQGWFFAFPISIAGLGGEATEIIAIASPWGVPLTIGIRGTSGSSAEPTMWIALEQEIPWLRPDARLDKKMVEFMHVQRFAADCRGATGAEPYAAIEGNKEDLPPDFFATLADGNRVGLECAAFSVEDRRRAEALFRNLKNKLVFQQRHRTGHLTGCSVIMWFGKGQSPDTRPPSKNDDVAAEELIEALSQYRPNVEALRTQFSAGMPPQMPPLGTGSASKDATFYAVPMLNSIPVGPFTSISGYNIVLAYSTQHTASSVAAVVEKLVQDHDKEGVDTLLITSGGPDRDGVMHPLEQILSDFYLQNPKTLKTDHINHVIMHRWPTGDAYDLLETPPKPLWPAVYQGHAPAHQPFVANNTAEYDDPGTGV